MTTLTVGTGGTYATIAAAVAASRDGDVLAVKAGTYKNDFATIGKKITIEGVGGMVHLVATTSPPNGKAIFTTTTDVTIRNLEFSGARVPDGNGAGIRYEGGKLTVENSSFHDNQNGILGGAVRGGTITIRDTEFNHNGSGDGRTHNLYVGEIAKLTVDHSWLHDAVSGHQVKSRALETVITNSRITDGINGTGSYSVDLPNGGKALIQGNVIEQGSRSSNPAIIHFGGEGGPHAGSSLTVTGNTVVNDMNSPSSALLLNHTSVVADIHGDVTYGLTSSQIAKGPAAVAGITTLLGRPVSDLSHPYHDSPAGGTSPTPTPSPVPNPAPVAMGKLVLHVSEDAWNGHAQYKVSVDGVQVGGVRTANASHAAGASEAVNLGSFAAGKHDVAVTFLNDAWGGTAATDRNLYVDKLSFGGVDRPVDAALLRNDTVTTTVGQGHDLALRLSEDAWNGHANYTVRADGQVLGSGTVTASHAAGKTQEITFDHLATAPRHVEVQFTNDAWGGTAATDRNLYVDAVLVDGRDLHVEPATLQRNGSVFYDVSPLG